MLAGMQINEGILFLTTNISFSINCVRDRILTDSNMLIQILKDPSDQAINQNMIFPRHQSLKTSQNSPNHRLMDRVTRYNRPMTT
jgi:kynureninase